MVATFPYPPESWSIDRAPELWRLMALSLRGVLRGKSNNVRLLVLLVDETTTELVDESITANTVALFSPRSANAAAEMATMYAVSTVGKVTFTHGSSANTDRTFGVVLIG